MLKRTLPFLVLCVLTRTVLAAADPFIGKWTLNPSKSTIRDVMKVEAAGPNRYAVYLGGSEPETLVADGTDQPGTSGTTLAITVEQPDTWKVVRKMNGRTQITATWKLSANGQTLTDAFSAVRPDGSTFNVDIAYKRTGTGSGFVGTWESTNTQVGSAFEVQVEAYEGAGLSFAFLAQQRTQHLKFDGKDYPDAGANASAGATTSGRRINEHTLEMTAKQAGKVLSTQEVTVSRDLKTLTMTMRPAGQGSTNILVFDRQ